ITGTLIEMKDSLGSQLDVIDKNMDEEQIRSTIEEICQLRARSACLRECRVLLDKFSTVEAAMEEMRMQLDQNTLKCSETIKFASSVLPRLDEMTATKNEITEETTMAITRILYSGVANFRNLLLGKLHSWFKQALVFPPSRVANITQMNVCVGDAVEGTMNISAMSNLNVLNDWLIKLGDNIMRNLIHPIINTSAVVSTTTDPVKSSLYIFRVRSKKKNGGETNVDEIFDHLLSIFTHLNASLVGVESNSNSLASVIMKIVFPQLQMAILKNVISPRSTNDAEIDETMAKAEQFREQLVESGLINDASPSFKRFAETHGKVFTDRKCITRVVKARDLILMPYVDLTTVGYGEEEHDENKFDDDSLAALGIRGDEASDDTDTSYPFFFRLLKCKISTSTKELVDLVRETVYEATKAENEEMAGRLMLTARNMIEMFILLTKSHSTAFSSVPQMAAIYHNNCHYIGHRLMLMVFDIVNEKQAVILNSFRSFFAPFLLQLRRSAAQVMSNQLLQIRRNVSTLLADASMSVVSSIERGSNACTMQLTSIANVWKEVLPELVYCGAMSNIIGFFFDQLSHLMLTVEDITANDATFIANTLSTTLRQMEKLLVIRGSPMLHKECAKQYFHFKEIIFMLNASLQVL
ncbi:czw-1, partial [Pristionchus pacificus]